jgi:hypothetical protein
MVNSIEVVEDFLPSAVSVGDLAKPELLIILREHDIHLNQAAEDLFADPRFQPCRQAAEIQIAALSVSALGFQEGATYSQITARALELGFAECSLELAAYLRLQFRNQPAAADALPSAERKAPSGAITIASAPLDTADKTPKGFYLRHLNGVLWLRGYWSDASHIWSPEDVLVFALD